MRRLSPPSPTAGPLLLLLGTLAVGCQPSQPWTSENPTFALNHFLTALRYGDLETIEAFLSDESISLLQDNRQARQQLLGEDDADDPHPAASLYRVWTPAATEIDRLETLERDADSARVAIHTVFGEVHTVTMYRTRGRWVIHLQPAQLAEPGPDTRPPGGP